MWSYVSNRCDIFGILPVGYDEEDDLHFYDEEVKFYKQCRVMSYVNYRSSMQREREKDSDINIVCFSASSVVNLKKNNTRSSKDNMKSDYLK